ncbi:PhzF family phenazine biosynthesis protein [Streptomyces bohaiensis]|uniref:PhzF family phenazine biosynthesis protein n=1 Tax=Streptomyces bohaiensis TaxID=1431344 RepID=A0ABX1CHJ3_9ACTN|nr:PhzF family phenazine biosynthesis protein [Streptomyces bohaiensis]NJQ15934.1 PhzF family phenazine biosynthesis protein [Streptomyces bohaiensis]
MRIRCVDAFTDRPFAGNPAGVVVLTADGFPEEAVMAAVAAEVNLSETAFVHPLPPGGAAEWALRWFTPTTEVRMCGHATLATAHVLATAEGVAGTQRFATLSGVLTATPADEDDCLTLDFPTAPLRETPVPGAVADALGAPVLGGHDTGPDVGDLLVELPDEATVRALRPDLGALAELPGRGVIVTAAADGSRPGYDFVSRFFGPAVGVPEDPVTGSAHTALAPLWARRLGRGELVGRQVSARGGTVRVAVRGDRTLLTGAAVTVMEGTFLRIP